MPGSDQLKGVRTKLYTQSDLALPHSDISLKGISYKSACKVSPPGRGNHVCGLDSQYRVPTPVSRLHLATTCNLRYSGSATMEDVSDEVLVMIVQFVLHPDP
jgi:hypothetical protein